MSIPLEPDEGQRAELSRAVLEYLETWYRRAADLPASGPEPDQDLLNRLLLPPGEEGRTIGDLLVDLDEAGNSGIYHPSGGHLSYIPNAGLYSSALADLLAAGLNRYTGIAGAAPGMTALEHGVTRWMTDLFGFGPDAAGLLVSGGSLANFTAVVAARTARLGDSFTRGVLYVTDHTHHSVAKAARIAGLGPDQVRPVPVDDELRMDPAGLEGAIDQDRRSGLEPFMVVATAGTTDTGTIDPLAAIAEITTTHRLWMHVDGAYGGFFRLTERGRRRLAGIERADSIAVDPHKGLSMPFGVGALLVRDEGALIDANQGRGAYLTSQDTHLGLRDIASLGPELSRPFRGLLVWLPLHLHGVAVFRSALEEALDLAETAHARLSTIPGVETPWVPDLSIVAFRLEDDDLARKALEAVNADRSIHISPTTVDGRLVLRLAVLNRRTTREHVDLAIDLIEKALAG